MAFDILVGEEKNNQMMGQLRWFDPAVTAPQVSALLTELDQSCSRWIAVGSCKLVCLVSSEFVVYFIYPF